jgi:hypothetical protein
MHKKSSISTECSALFSGKETLGKGTDLVGRRGQIITWYPSIGMVSRNKQGKITAFCPSTQVEDSDIVMISRSDPVLSVTPK